MNTYKLTVPCTVVDINGNTVNTEKMIVFTNKEELLEYISGDTDGDNYGSGLINIRKYDNKLYEEVGRMCNHITHLLWLENANKERHVAASVCHQILNYMMFPSIENAKKLYPVLQETHLNFLRNCYFRLKDMDVDGDRPWEQEWCDKFIGMIRSNPKILAEVMAHSANYVIDVWKE